MLYEIKIVSVNKTGKTEKEIRAKVQEQINLGPMVNTKIIGFVRVWDENEFRHYEFLTENIIT